VPSALAKEPKGKVLWITSVFPTSDEDPRAPFLTGLVTRLRDRGWDIEVLAPSFRKLRSHTAYGVNVHRFRYFLRRWENLTHDYGAPYRIRNPFYFSMVPAYLLAGMLSAHGLCRRTRFDVIHVQWPIPHMLFAWTANLGRRHPVAISFHGAGALLVKRFPPLKPLLRRALRSATIVSCNSSFTREQILGLSGSDAQIEIIPYGPARHTGEPCDEIMQGDVCRILYVGRFVERKGVGYLIRAMPEVLKHARVRVDLVGEGPDREDCAALVDTLGIADSVHFHGNMSDEEMAGLFADCDLLVLPSIVDSRGDTEGLGMVLVEALLMQKAVITTGVGGTVDVVKDGQTGLLVPQKSAEHLANAILRLVGDPNLARRLAKQGRDYARQTFDWNVIADKWDALYDGMMSQHRQRCSCHGREMPEEKRPKGGSEEE